MNVIYPVASGMIVVINMCFYWLL